MTLALASLLAALFCVALAIFHAALALGAPLGAYAWGSDVEGPLPRRQQIGSTVLTPLILLMAVALLIRGGWLYPGEAAGMVIPVWGVLLFLLTQMFGSFRSTSKPERRVTARLLLVGVVLTGIVAYGGITAG